MKSNSTLRQEGLRALKERWGRGVMIYLAYIIIVVASSLIPVAGWLASIFIVMPLAYGLQITFLENYRDSSSVFDVSGLFLAFQGNTTGRSYLDVVGTMLLVGIYTFLWTILLVVPGVIKSLSYSMTPFILRDCPELSFNAAIERSMAMMKGYKLKLLLMQLNFIMWSLLSILTLGIAMLWIGPYMWSTSAAFYEDVKANYNAVQ